MSGAQTAELAPQHPQMHRGRNKPKEKETNPLKKIYDNIWNYGFGAWISAIVVLGLSAGIISKKPGGSLRAAAAYNLALVCRDPQTVQDGQVYDL